MCHLIGALLLIANFSVTSAQEVPAQRDESAGRKLLKPMKLPGSAYEIRAGKIEVWENHRTKTGRKIPFNVIVIPAKARNPSKATLFPLAGGPGNAETASVT